MMRRWHLLSLILLIGSVLPASPGHAQDQPESAPLVVFIEDAQLRTASLLDSGPDGVTQLEQLFKNLGARTAWLGLDEPLPEEAAVIVIVRPLATLPPTSLARIWLHLARGGHLFLTTDPAGLVTERGEDARANRTDGSRSGLSILLTLFYGIQLEDTFLSEPWFTNTTITSQNTTFLTTHAEPVVSHPITLPLVHLGLPVQVWGARSLRVEPFGASNYAIPLLYTDSAYGETNTRVFPQTSGEPAPLEINLDQDKQGHLVVGALGENTRLGSRVIVLGDSEIVLNAYGLAPDLDGTPLYPGNRLLIERSIAWLLGLPDAEWPVLADVYTNFALDGAPEDWADREALFEEDNRDAPTPEYDIQTVRAFRDDSFLYMLIETASPSSPHTRLALDLETNSDGAIDLSLILTPDQAIWHSATVSPTAIPDGDLVTGPMIEVRLPLRVVTEGAIMSHVCLTDSRTAEDTTPIDCTGETPGVVPVVTSEAPVEVRFPPGPRAIVTTLQAGVNVRADTNAEADIVDLVPNGRIFAVTGRTALGDWIQVNNGAYTGWMADFLLDLNVDLSDVPIVPH
jgi:hypothetical protein